MSKTKPGSFRDIAPRFGMCTYYTAMVQNSSMADKDMQLCEFSTTMRILKISHPQYHVAHDPER